MGHCDRPDVVGRALISPGLYYTHPSQPSAPATSDTQWHPPAAPAYHCARPDGTRQGCAKTNICTDPAVALPPEPSKHALQGC